MSPNDRAWRLGSSYGVIVGTVREFAVDGYEFFVDEAEAHDADAARCAKEAERCRHDASGWDNKQVAANKKAAALRAAK